MANIAADFLNHLAPHWILTFVLYLTVDVIK